MANIFKNEGANDMFKTPHGLSGFFGGSRTDEDQDDDTDSEADEKKKKDDSE